MIKKIIISDVDGTLLGHGGGLHPSNRDAILKLKQENVLFGIATGRDVTGLQHIEQLIGRTVDFGIIGNGAQVIDAEGKILFESYLKKDDFNQILAIFKQLQLPIMIFTTDGIFSLNPELTRRTFIKRIVNRLGISPDEFDVGGSREHMPCNQLLPITNDKTFYDEHPKIIKVESFLLNDIDLKNIHEGLSQLTQISTLSSFFDNIEITHRLAQKGDAIEKLISVLAIEHDEVVVVGDAANDYSMFEKFSNCYAPENAIPEIKHLAKKVVSSAGDGAVSEVIQIVLNEKNND